MSAAQLRSVPVVTGSALETRDIGVTLRIFRSTEWQTFSLTNDEAENLGHALLEAAVRSERENYTIFAGAD